MGLLEWKRKERIHVLSSPVVKLKKHQHFLISACMVLPPLIDHSRLVNLYSFKILCQNNSMMIGCYEWKMQSNLYMYIQLEINTSKRWIDLSLKLVHVIPCNPQERKLIPSLSSSTERKREKEKERERKRSSFFSSNQHQDGKKKEPINDLYSLHLSYQKLPISVCRRRRTARDLQNCKLKREMIRNNCHKKQGTIN